jgi:hypothetical protein
MFPLHFALERNMLGLQARALTTRTERTSVPCAASALFARHKRPTSPVKLKRYGQFRRRKLTVKSLTPKSRRALAVVLTGSYRSTSSPFIPVRRLPRVQCEFT